ncbi:MAG: gliding motility lipoprotein GldH [Bacteroidales bacterium]|jgi:gliding motility-associated lipoprotein GldH|nr:gliding motility lipoprotein GldH [Bacteroidales bacterium]MDD4395026.1 gliding motility lipoprotein GldH [Bacteroidales bacterium]
MKYRNVFLCLFLSLFLFSSCKHDIFYEEIHSIENETWNVKNVLNCEFEITDTMQFYTMYMDIRNSVDFETRNLYVFMDTEDPNGTKSRDTLEFVLADAHGNWKGKGNGRLKDYQYLFYPKVRFPYKGTYHFSFQQAMRQDDVVGIANFGMTVYTFDEKRFIK